MSEFLRTRDGLDSGELHHLIEKIRDQEHLEAQTLLDVIQGMLEISMSMEVTVIGLQQRVKRLEYLTAEK